MYCNGSCYLRIYSHSRYLKLVIRSEVWTLQVGCYGVLTYWWH